MTFEDPRRLITRRRFVRSADAATAEGSATPVTRGVRRIVLTGGPGSGKSTAAAFLAREFVDDLWVLPESATLLYKGGLPRSPHALGVQIAQRAIFNTQRSLEAATQLQHPDRVQLCDRCTVDGAAYWPDGPDAFFQSMGTTRQLELARYDAVVFMHSAALMPAGYERDLDVRTEDRDEAIELDRRMFELYGDHPHMIAIESSASFLDKLIAVRNAIADILAAPAPDPEQGSVQPRETDDPGRILASERSSNTSPFLAITGDATELSMDFAPISSLMGLASVGHILPVD